MPQVFTLRTARSLSDTGPPAMVPVKLAASVFGLVDATSRGSRQNIRRFHARQRFHVELHWHGGAHGTTDWSKDDDADEIDFRASPDLDSA